MTNKAVVEKYLADKFSKIKEVNEKVWNYAEIGLEEMKSVTLYERLLTEEEFEIETGIAGMPTVFVATYGSGSPVIGITAEYDALPNLSQTAGVAEKSRIEVGGDGHGCGHNSLGAASFGGVLIA